jgi:catechol 2,3-dioxygenase-like lactoylglutathione lyase family enzyme
VLDHVTISVSDFARSRAFYDAALAPLGISCLYADEDKAAGYGQGSKAFFWIAAQDRPPSQTHVAFKASQSAEVGAFYAAALAHGGRDNGPPGPRPEYHDGYYAAFVLDPDGNNIEAVIQ